MSLYVQIYLGIGLALAILCGLQRDPDFTWWVGVLMIVSWPVPLGMMVWRAFRSD